MPSPAGRIRQQWKRLAGWPRRMSIVTRLVVLLLVVLLVPLSITASLNMERTAAIMEENEYLRLQQTSRTAAARVAQVVGDTSRILSILQTDPAIVRVCADRREETTAHPRPRRADTLMQERVAAATRGLLARAAAWNQDLDRVALADTEGMWIAFSNSALGEGKHDDAAQSCARRALKGETLTAEALSIGDGRGIYFAAPVLDANKDILGALVVRMDHAVLVRLCGEGAESASHPQMAVLDRDREILAHSSPKRIGKKWTGIQTSSGVPGVGVEEDGMTGARVNSGRAGIRNTGWTLLVTQQTSILEDAVNHLRRRQAAVALLAASAVLVLAIIQSREITKPLRALRLAALRVARGDLEAKAPILLHDEVGELAHAFNLMTERLREHAKLRSHLRLAQDIQRRLLPEIPPVMEGLDIAGFNRPADETGGDYYDFVDLSEWAPNHLAVFVGDVTGHGVPAAILMATARAHIRACVMPPRDLAQVMGDANRRMMLDTPPGRFITLAAVVIDARERRLRWSTAGHDGAMLYDPCKNRVGDLEGEDIPLGVDAGWRFHEHGGGTVPAGSVILLGTDGVWETRNEAGEHFGKERLRALLHESHAKGAEDIRRDITMAVDAFRGLGKQEDDLTLVVVKIGG